MGGGCQVGGWRGGARAEHGGEAFAAAVKVGTDGVDGHGQSGGDAVVAALLLMIEDEDGAFYLR
jgi:hypothetical protein